MHGLNEGDNVFVIGMQGIVEELEEVGLCPVQLVTFSFCEVIGLILAFGIDR